MPHLRDPLVSSLPFSAYDSELMLFDESESRSVVGGPGADCWSSFSTILSEMSTSLVLSRQGQVVISVAYILHHVSKSFSSSRSAAIGI